MLTQSPLASKLWKESLLYSFHIHHWALGRSSSTLSTVRLLLCIPISKTPRPALGKVGENWVPVLNVDAHCMSLGHIRYIRCDVWHISKGYTITILQSLGSFSCAVHFFYMYMYGKCAKQVLFLLVFGTILQFVGIFVCSYVMHPSFIILSSSSLKTFGIFFHKVRTQKSSLELKIAKNRMTFIWKFPNEEPAKLNRDVALRAVRPNSLFSNVVFS
jgi:hypothetical protein